MSVQLLGIVMAFMCFIVTALMTSAPVILFATWCYTNNVFFLGATFVWIVFKALRCVTEYWQNTQHIALMAKYLSKSRKEEEG